MTTAATIPADSPRARIQGLLAQLNTTFPERRDAIQGVLLAVLTGEHVLLLGPPGTAKSALCRAIAQVFGGSYFERLLTKFSTPEELFGPISLKALEQDRYERVVSGKLPTAHFAFVDEVFRANSAILNALLTAMNEKVFHNDGAPLHMPLVSLFGAANDLPEGRELEALFDRFLLRFDVQYLLRATHLKAVLLAPDPILPTNLDLQTLQSAQAEVQKVKVSDPTVETLLTIREACRADGIVASDRRWKKSLNLVRAAAYLAGEQETTPEDLLVLVDALWREPKDRPKIARLVGEHADPVSAQATEILDAARESAAAAVRVDNETRADFINKAAKALEAFVAQKARLQQLARGAGPRATATIQEATQEITALHTDLAKKLSSGLGLRGS